MAAFSGVLAYLFWNGGVAGVGASVAALFVHLRLAFGVLFAYLILGERLEPYHVAGIPLILTGARPTTPCARSGVEVEASAAAGTD